MTLGLGFTYCTQLTCEEVNLIDLKTRQNRQRFKKRLKKIWSSDGPYLLGILPFFQGVTQGWVDYYIKCSPGAGDKVFTEKQFKLVSEAAETLRFCEPIESFLPPDMVDAIRDNVKNNLFGEAIRHLDTIEPSITRTGWCVTTLKFALWAVQSSGPEIIRDATYNLLRL